MKNLTQITDPRSLSDISGGSLDAEELQRPIAGAWLRRRRGRRPGRQPAVQVDRELLHDTAMSFTATDDLWAFRAVQTVR